MKSEYLFLLFVIPIYITVSVCTLVLEYNSKKFDNRLWYYNLISIFLLFNLQNFRKLTMYNYYTLSLIMIHIFGITISYSSYLLYISKDSFYQKNIPATIFLALLNIMIQLLFIIAYMFSIIHFKKKKIISVEPVFYNIQEYELSI